MDKYRSPFAYSIIEADMISVSIVCEDGDDQLLEQVTAYRIDGVTRKS